MIYEEFYNFIIRSNQLVFIEAEAREERMRKFVDEYNNDYDCHISLKTEGVRLLGDVDKWGVELRIYFNSLERIPSYWNRRKYHNRAYRSDEFTYRIDDNSLAKYLFSKGYMIGYNDSSGEVDE